ncbi:ketoacyl-ACP synthase III [Candidatus Acetothermia bacterium]|jgi:3-oxoacyl-[acyl-carrier-protein] synthase-3|nr:ketoacyl-ACP synthase III [Candidatus Acetothermia bacterium]MCI2431310.1 ketoacyl-ACP synthase III [Candidatus Acetothermia bacterium]MCI2436964.1 ketoacyl-ACP synthase III [Candidatus Acetothermia bacterium]
MKMRPGIAGVGCAVPERVLTNADLEKLVETSDEWITARTGIRERRILRADEDPADLGIAAARQAIEHAGLFPADIDFLITATNVSEMLVPGSSPFICEGLKIKKEIPFFDLIAGCTGFVYALKIAADLVSSGSYGNVLVVGLEALSRFTDWQDRSTCVLFGDGAGAAVVRKISGDRGILASCLAADSSKWDLLRIDAGGVKTPASLQTVEQRQHYLKMAGSEVFKSAVQMMAETTEKALAQAQLSKYDIDWVVPHQANRRIITALAKRLDIPMEKVIVNIERYANTSTASIPLALREALDDGRLQPGEIVVLSAFGAGVTYGSIVLRW